MKSIKNYVEQAQEAASTVTDPELKLKTYELVLSHLLKSGFEEVQNPETSKAVSLTEIPDSPLGKIASWLGVSPELVEEVFSASGDEVELIIPTSKVPKRISDAQRMLSLIKLAGDKVGFGQMSVPAQKLVSICKEYTCFDGNFAINLKSYDKYIISKGAKGKMKSYEIRRKGLEQAAEELRRIIGE